MFRNGFPALVATLAVVGIIGGAAALVMNDRSSAGSDVADRARLAIQLRQPKPTAAPTGQIAVLDPSQVQPASSTSAPPSPRRPPDDDDDEPE